MNTSTDSSVDSDHLLHSFNNSSDSQISKNNNKNNNNNENNFNRNQFITRSPPSPNTSSESSRGYWPDHVLNGGPLIRRVTEGEEGSTGTSESESELDEGVGGSNDDIETRIGGQSLKPMEESYGNRVEGSRRNTITNSSNSRPYSASQPLKPSTSTHRLSNPTVQYQQNGLISRDSENRQSTPQGEILPPSMDNISVNSSKKKRNLDNESSDGSRYHRSKGKERARRNDRTYTTSASDPLDPLSSLRHPLSSNIYSQSSSAVLSPASIAHSLYDKSTTSPRLNNDQTIYVPQTQPAPQSLQQLLQTVDLSAALLLVQTLQKNQQQAQKSTPLPPPEASPTPFSDSNYNHERDRTTSSNYFSDQTNAMSISSADTHTPLLPPASLSPPHSPSKISYANNSEGSSTRPRASTFLSSNNASSSTATEKKDRRRSLSFNFGAGNVSKKLRISSMNGKDNLPKVKERILDDRAYIGEHGRDFEEQIAKVHLNLSPSTMRRAQNCSKYLSLRYSPLYTALASPDLPLPNSLAVSRWRNEKEEAERRFRRAQLGTIGRSRTFCIGSKEDAIEFDGSRSIDGVRSDGGSSINRNLSKSLKASTASTTSVYGPRRNIRPKAWELYPDEISEFVETNGRILEPEVVELSSGRAISARSTSIGSSYREGMTGMSQVRTPIQTAPNSPIFTNASLPLSPSLDNSLNSSRHISTSSGVEGSALSRSTTGRSSININSPISRNALSVGSSYQFPPQSASTKSPLATSTDSTSRFNSPKLATELTYESLSPRVSTSSKPNGTNTPSLSISKQHEGGRLRHSLTRRLDKIRGKGSELELPSDSGTIGINSRSRRGSLPMSTDPSESEMVSKLSVNHSRNNTLGGELPVLSSGSSFRRRTSKISDTSGEGGYRSSGGEENSRKLVKGRWKPNKWQGFGGRNIGSGENEMVSLEEGVQLGAPFVVKKRILRIEESDDDEYKPPREILDLGDEEFSRLNTILRQVRVQLSHVDSFLPRVPTQLNQYLESITQHDTMTFKSLNIPVQYSHPRLTASVISQLANIKVRQFSPRLVTGRVATSSSAETSSDSSSEDSDEERDDTLTIDGKKAHPATAASIRFRPPRRDSQARHVSGGHARRVTDPISRGVPTGRARSQTLASTATGSGIGSGGGGSAIRDLIHPTGLRVDRLALLEKAIADLEKGKKEVEGEIDTTMKFQETIRQEINEFFVPVDQLIQVMNSTYELKLQRVEKHFFRLNTSQTKSGFSVDILWGLLSYIITIALLLFWAFATIWNFIYAIVKSPFIFLRWLFFPFSI